MSVQYNFSKYSSMTLGCVPFLDLDARSKRWIGKGPEMCFQKVPISRPSDRRQGELVQRMPSNNMGCEGAFCKLLIVEHRRGRGLSHVIDENDLTLQHQYNTNGRYSIIGYIHFYVYVYLYLIERRTNAKKKTQLKY